MFVNCHSIPHRNQNFVEFSILQNNQHLSIIRPPARTSRPTITLDPHAQPQWTLEAGACFTWFLWNCKFSYPPDLSHNYRFYLARSLTRPCHRDIYLKASNSRFRISIQFSIQLLIPDFNFQNLLSPLWLEKFSLERSYTSNSLTFRAPKWPIFKEEELSTFLIAIDDTSPPITGHLFQGTDFLRRDQIELYFSLELSLIQRRVAISPRDGRTGLDCKLRRIQFVGYNS